MAIDFNVATTDTLVPTTRTKRLLNFLIDGFIIGTISTFTGVVELFICPSASCQYSLGRIEIIILGVTFLYYFVTELLWSKTIAKFVTKTHVVAFDGLKPSASKLAARAAARWIPFDPLSYLIKTRPMGWHDRISGTIVIDDG